MTKTDDFEFDEFNDDHQAINNFFKKLNTQEIVINFMIPLYHFALLDELKTEKYKDNQGAQELKNQLEKENINIDEIKNQIPELKIDGNKVDTFDLIKKFVLHKASFYAGYNIKPPVDSIIDYGIEKLDKEIKSAGWMLFFGGSFINQQIKFVYDYLASQLQKTTNKSNSKELGEEDKTVEISEIKNEDTEMIWQSCLKEFFECKDFVSSWKNSTFSDSEFSGHKNMINDEKLRRLQLKLINALKQVDKIEYQSLYEVIDTMNLNPDDKKFIYCNVIPNISEMMTRLNENINSPQSDFYSNPMDNENTVQKKIYGLTLYKDKKIGINDLIFDFFDNNPGLSSAKEKIDFANMCNYAIADDLMFDFFDNNSDLSTITTEEKIDFANVCNDVITVLQNGGIINQDTADDLTRQIKNATDVSTLGIIWQAIVNLFKNSVTEQKVVNMADKDIEKSSPKVSTWEKLKQDRAISNLEKPLSQLSELLNTKPRSDHNKY